MTGLTPARVRAQLRALHTLTRPLADDELRALDWAETRAEDIAAERRGDNDSEQTRDRMADEAADRYERWMEGP